MTYPMFLFLLRKGAQYKHDFGGFLVGIIYGGNVDIMEHLIKEVMGENPNQLKIVPAAAMSVACSYNQVGIARLLHKYYGEKCKDPRCYETAKANNFSELAEFLSELDYMQEYIIQEQNVDSKVNPDKGKNECCMICFDNQKRVLFEPCNHYGFCFACSDKLDKCPFCKTKKKGAKRVYEL